MVSPLLALSLLTDVDSASLESTSGVSISRDGVIVVILLFVARSFVT